MANIINTKISQAFKTEGVSIREVARFLKINDKALAKKLSKPLKESEVDAIIEAIFSVADLKYDAQFIYRR